MTRTPTILFACFCLGALAQDVIVVTNAPPSVTLGWESAVSHDPQVTVTNYSLFIGPQSGIYTERISLGKTNTVRRVLQRGQTYYFAVNATDSDGLHTELSNEVSWTARTPLEPPMLWLTNMTMDLKITISR